MMSEKNSVRIERLDWDKECKIDLLTKKGFEIKQRATSGEEKLPYGSHSPKFYTDWEDEESHKKRYSCKCKELEGRVYEGEVCPKCGSEVKVRDVDMKIFGWIILNDYKFINPYFFKLLSMIFGKKKQFERIVEYDKELSRDGLIRDKKSDKEPFKGIGIIEFRERFDEIMQYLLKTKKKKREEILEVINNKDKVFTSCIPVFSSVLRPISFKNGSFFFNPIDKKINSIVTAAMILNNDEYRKKTRSKRVKMEVPELLGSIQNDLNSLWELIFSEIVGKEGQIRGQILGGRVNYTARNVIKPDSTLRSNEVRIGYLTFLELYKYEIIAHLHEINNYSYTKAYHEWYSGTINFSPRIYEIMQYILKTYKPHVGVNRNPTINYGSFITLKVVSITRRYESFTMSLPIQVLSTLNADFDGDTLNILALKTKEMVKRFDKNFNPRKNMYISRNDGLFNSNFGLHKDQIIGLYEFNNI